jgi:sugar lactone lactonase YvrE
MNDSSNGSTTTVRSRRSRVGVAAGLAGVTALLVGAVSTSAAYPMPGAEAPGPSRNAAPIPKRDADARPIYVIPGKCVLPESVAVYAGKYYTGGVCSGKIYRGDLTKRRAAVFVPAGPNPVSVGGIEATATRLIVANAGSGFAKVYNRFTGQRVARFWNGSEPGESIVNDVAVAPNGDAYLTEYRLSKIYRIPANGIAQHQPGVQKLPVWLNLRGTAFPVRDGSANGIAATPDGRFLIVTHFSAGELYRIRISDQHVSKIRLHGKHLAGPDGIVLSNADVLYVVEAHKQRIAEIRLSDHYDRGRVVSRTTSPRFRCPSGVAIAGDRLLVSNLQYGCEFKLPFTVASIPIP